MNTNIANIIATETYERNGHKVVRLIAEDEGFVPYRPREIEEHDITEIDGIPIPVGVISDQEYAVERLSADFRQELHLIAEGCQTEMIGNACNFCEGCGDCNRFDDVVAPFIDSLDMSDDLKEEIVNHWTCGNELIWNRYMIQFGGGIAVYAPGPENNDEIVGVDVSEFALAFHKYLGWDQKPVRDMISHTDLPDAQKTAMNEILSKVAVPDMVLHGKLWYNKDLDTEEISKAATTLNIWAKWVIKACSSPKEKAEPKEPKPLPRNIAWRKVYISQKSQKNNVSDVRETIFGS